MFIKIIDKFGNPYFSQNVTGMDWLVNLTAITTDASGLFSHEMKVSTRATSRFTSDLTGTRDDVILAFLNLILMFCIEAIVTTVLLRTKDNDIGNFAFSIKLVIELLRDFNLRYIWRGRRRGPRAGTALNVRLVCLALFILFFSLGLEVGILFLTSRELRDVSNSTTAFRIQQPVLPGWDEVRFHSRASLNRPCIATALVGARGIVDGSRTKINGCVSSDLFGNEFQLFSKVEEEVDVKISSSLHEYGAEHEVKIGNLSAEYSVRVFFSLDGDNGDSRLMKEASPSRDEDRQIEVIHKQYVAYLYTSYLLGTEDHRMNLTRLNNLRFNRLIKESVPEVIVLNIGGKQFKRKARRYITTVKGIIPQGAPALRAAQDMFRGLTAIVLTKPDVSDLFVRDGPRNKPAPVWRESGRVVNWLSMLIILSSALVILVTARVALKPVAIADVAGVWVMDAVGANTSSSPVRFGDSSQNAFRVDTFREQEWESRRGTVEDY